MCQGTALCSSNTQKSTGKRRWETQHPWSSPRQVFPASALCQGQFLLWQVWSSACSSETYGTQPLPGRQAMRGPALSLPRRSRPPRSPSLRLVHLRPAVPGPLPVPGVPYLAGGPRPPPASPARPRRARGAELRGRPPAWPRSALHVPGRALSRPHCRPGSLLAPTAAPCGPPAPPRSPSLGGLGPPPGPARPGSAGVTEECARNVRAPARLWDRHRRGRELCPIAPQPRTAFISWCAVKCWRRAVFEVVLRQITKSVLYFFNLYYM